MSTRRSSAAGRSSRRSSRAPEWQRGMESVQVIERDDARPSVDLRDRRRCAVHEAPSCACRSATTRPRRLEFARLGLGRVDHLEGSWELSEAGSGSDPRAVHAGGRPGQRRPDGAPAGRALRPIVVGQRPRGARGRSQHGGPRPADGRRSQLGAVVEPLGDVARASGSSSAPPARSRRRRRSRPSPAGSGRRRAARGPTTPGWTRLSASRGISATPTPAATSPWTVSKSSDSNATDRLEPGAQAGRDDVLGVRARGRRLHPLLVAQVGQHQLRLRRQRVLGRQAPPGSGPRAAATERSPAPSRRRRGRVPGNS